MVKFKECEECGDEKPTQAFRKNSDICRECEKVNKEEEMDEEEKEAWQDYIEKINKD